MANDPKDTDPKNGQADPPAPDTEPSAEDKFWSKFDERLDAAVGRGVEKFFKKRDVGTSRTGRTTLPGILADIMGGPFARDKQE